MVFLGYVSSVFMGMVLGLIGGGGSILTVPILVYLFAQPPAIATGSSLFVVGMTALAGATKFIQGGKVRVTESLFFALPSVVGVLSARRILVPLIPQSISIYKEIVLSKDILLMALFAALMLVASIKMLKSSSQASFENAKSSSVLLSLQGLLVGLVTGFIGAGGGFLIVPALIFILGFKMQEAVGTSLIIIAINSFVGLLASLGAADSLRWDILLPITGLSIGGMLLGNRFQGKFSDHQLKKSFGVFVLVIGSFILADQIFNTIS